MRAKIINTVDWIEQLSDVHIEQLHTLYKHEWWTESRTFEQTQQVVVNSSINIAAVDANNELVAYARVLSDGIFKAMIYDVIVKADYRKKGLGEQLMMRIKAHDAVRKVKDIGLFCLPEMCGFYDKFDFEETDEVVFMKSQNI